jgi:hypothetical protein
VKTFDLDVQAETGYGKITIRAYRLFTSNYGWLMIGPGAILSTGYFVFAALLALLSLWFFFSYPIARWLRDHAPWFTFYYLGWLLAWIALAYFVYPSQQNMGKIFIVLFLNLIHAVYLIPSWRELEAKLFQTK